MKYHTIIVALVWGTLSGYFALRILDSLLAVAFCLHGLLSSRWKWLNNKAAPGQIRYSIVLKLLLRVTAYGLLCGYLLEAGDSFIRRKFSLVYHAPAEFLWGAMAVIVAVVFLRTSWRRLIVVWKMSHEFDFAEKRQRGFLLKR